MLILFLFLSAVLMAVWLISEFRCRTRTRLILGFATIASMATTAFLMGAFGEALKHAHFPVPHDSPEDRALVDAAVTNVTNSVGK
jgi:hypothetical protein